MKANKKVGRPKKDIKKDKLITIRITTKQKDKVKKYAMDNDLTMSEVIDISIDSFLYSNE
jgi:hypothetical protein